MLLKVLRQLARVSALLILLLKILRQLVSYSITYIVNGATLSKDVIGVILFKQSLPCRVFTAIDCIRKAASASYTINEFATDTEQKRSTH